MKRPVLAAGDRKGVRTRAQITREAAALFNMRGYAGTSVNDVSAATGLEKGGVYNHFGSKDELALAAFDYAASLVAERLAAAVRERPDGAGKLTAVLDVYRTLSERPFVVGGCPLLNTAVDSDDTHPALRDRVRLAMTGWLDLIADALETGRSAGQFRSDFDVKAASGTIVAALEGGILLSKLYRDAAWMRGVTDQLAAYIDGLKSAPR